MNTTGLRPTVGSRYRVVADHHFRLAVADAPVIAVPRGTHLEVVRLDERWDNTHADIARFGRVNASLRIMDGPSAGKEIAIVFTGDSVARTDGGEDETWQLPDWLIFGSHG